jgi:hypothetical protein
LKVLERAINSTSAFPNATSICLRIHPDLRWDGNFHVSPEPAGAAFSPTSEHSDTEPLAEISAGSFLEAAEVRERYPKRNPLDPGGALNYLHGRRFRPLGRRNQHSLTDFLQLLGCRVSDEMIEFVEKQFSGGHDAHGPTPAGLAQRTERNPHRLRRACEPPRDATYNPPFEALMSLLEVMPKKLRAESLNVAQGAARRRAAIDAATADRLRHPTRADGLSGLTSGA